MGEQQHLENLDVTLQWSEWTSWHIIKRYVQQRRLPDLIHKVPSVYEAKLNEQVERLYIGETGTGVNGTLHQRIRAFVRGNSDHYAGHKIERDRRSGLIRVNNIVIRWAGTDQHKHTESELLRTHRIEFDTSPKYNKR